MVGGHRSYPEREVRPIQMSVGPFASEPVGQLTPFATYPTLSFESATVGGGKAFGGCRQSRDGKTESQHSLRADLPLGMQFVCTVAVRASA